MSWTRNPDWGVVDRPDEADHGGVLYAADLAVGEILRLEGPAAVVARAAFEEQGLDEMRQSIADQLQVAPADIDESVAEAILQELEEVGLLVKL